MTISSPIVLPLSFANIFLIRIVLKIQRLYIQVGYLTRVNNSLINSLDRYRVYKSRFDDCNFLFNESEERKRDGSNQLTLSTDASKGACGIFSTCWSLEIRFLRVRPNGLTTFGFQSDRRRKGGSKGAREFLSSGGTRRLNFRFSQIAANSSPSRSSRALVNFTPSIYAIPIAWVTLNPRPPPHSFITAAASRL